MTSACRSDDASSLSRRALSMIETVMAMAMVSVLLVAALNTLGASKLGQRNTAIHATGQALAQCLMAEIMSQAYEDPDGFPIFGPEPGENGASRASFDDVDDYAARGNQTPKNKNGTLGNLPAGWQRRSDVVWVAPSDLATAVATDTGVKRITVCTTYQGAVIASLVATRTAGPPDPDPPINVLFVATDPANLTLQETAKQNLMASWGFTVQLIGQTESIANFLTASLNNDVVYVSLDATESSIPGKIKNLSLGIVNEQWSFLELFGFGSSPSAVTGSSILIADNTHYITNGYPATLVQLFNTGQPAFIMTGVLGSGAHVLGHLQKAGVVYYPAMINIDTGAALYGGGNATGRRVQLPWGGIGLDINALSTDGLTFMQRAIEWASGAALAAPPPPPAPICGDGLCEPAETCVCAADCIFLPWVETSCTDGYDNECDGLIDCADSDCSADPACIPCGNALCDAGEDCNTCSVDCSGVSTGNPSGRYCCGNGILEPAEGTGAICDGNP